MKELDKQLGSGKTAYVAPPACDKGSIYDITTKVSGLDDDKLLYVTSEDYLEFLRPEHFSKEINMKKFLKKPIYVFKTAKDYTKAAANASNVLICTGGRSVAIEEVVNALKNRNKIVLLINDDLKNGTFNKEKDSVENSAKFFENLMKPSWCKEYGYSMPSNLDIQYLRGNEDRIKQLVRVYHIKDDKESIKSAALRAGNFIKAKTIYDYIPEETLKKMSQKYGTQHIL